MKGLDGTVVPDGTSFSTEEEPIQAPVRQSPREIVRGFFAHIQREEPPDEGEIIWSLPPVWPFEKEEHNENSGFIARLIRRN